MLRDVGDCGALDAHRDVVPADDTSRRVILAVVGIPSVEREVDASDEGDAVVDHDRLLVMAVHEADAGVELAVDPVSQVEPLDHLPHFSSRRTEDRDRSAAPDQHAHVDPVGELGEQVSHDRGIVATRELELRREEAAGEMDVRLRSRQLFGDHRQERGPVDENLHRVSRANGCRPASPAASLGCERVLPSDLAQAPGVMCSDGAIDRAAEGMARCVSDLVVGCCERLVPSSRAWAGTVTRLERRRAQPGSASSLHPHCPILRLKIRKCDPERSDV